MLSLLSVSNSPVTCLRHWCSSRYLRIPSLHREFQSPLLHSSLPVPTASAELSPAFSQQAQQAAYEPFTPNNSGQRSRPTYYRGCWHVVSRRFLYRYPQVKDPCSLSKGVYNPKAFFLHAALLGQGFPIAQYSPLLPPVGVWAVSQSQCGRSPSQAGYPSKPW